VCSGIIWWKEQEQSGNLLEIVKPNNDLPNQEKNQYWTVYWWEMGALFTQEADLTSEREVVKTAQIPECVGTKTSNGSLFEMRNWDVVNENL